MLANKWCQATLLLGICVGAWFGTVLSFVNVNIPFGISVAAGFASMWIATKAKGTDGWGGPWHGPRHK